MCSLVRNAFDGEANYSFAKCDATFTAEADRTETRKPRLFGRVIRFDTAVTQVSLCRLIFSPTSKPFWHIRFWKRAGYIPLYVRQTQSELTGEHTCVMVRGLNSLADSELEWLSEFAKGA